MQQTLILHEDAWLRDGPNYASGPLIGYRVGGWPDGTTARVVNFRSAESERLADPADQC